MGIEENKATVRRYVEEVRNKGRYDLVPDLFSPDYEVNIPGLPAGVDGWRAMDAQTRTALPDFQFTIEELIAEGDRVAYHWTLRGTHLGPWLGVAATGKSLVRRGITVFALENGKITARYGYSNELEALRELGASVTS